MNTLISSRDINGDGFLSEIATGPEKAREGDYFDLAARSGIRVTIVPHLVRRISPVHDLLATIELASIIKKGRYTIVHTHGSKARLLGRLSAKLSGSRALVVQTFHGWPFDSTMSLAAQAGCAFMERLFFRLAAQSVTVTPEDIFKGVVWGIGRPDDYTVIRSGVEFSRFRSCRGKKAEARAELGLPQDCPVVGTVARLATVKDPLAFLSVAKRVVERLPECRFVLVGDGPLRTEVERGIMEAGLSSSVLLAGNREDVENLLPALDVFLLTSRSEGLPRVMLEALAAGVPVVSTDVGGVCELLTGDRNGVICPVGNTECLSNAVVGILTTPGKTERLLSGVDDSLEPFSAEKMVSDLRDLYVWLAKKAGR